MHAPIPHEALEATFGGRIVDIKEGNSGQVYIVDRLEQNQASRVAYKTFKIKKGLTEKEIGYFLDECELWFSIRNPYVVAPFYAEVIGGTPFICMPCCDSDLSTVMKGPKIEKIDALVLSCRLIKALVELRKSGINQHQDFNPPNVLVHDLQLVKDPSNALLNCSLLISDFGIANLREKLGPTLGGQGGKFPFKAPEQYELKRYEEYNPDIFSLGIMLYMLLTWTHPNGMPNDKALKRSTSSSYFRNWVDSKAEIELEEKSLMVIINQALERNPAQRPDPQIILDVFLITLRESNEKLHSFLVDSFNRSDYRHALYADHSQLSNLANIAALPGRRQTVLKRFLKLLDNQEANICTAFDLHYYGLLLKYLASILTRLDHPNEQVFKHATRMLELLPQFGPLLRANMAYPPYNFQNVSNPYPSVVRDFEIAGNYMTIALTLLEGRGVEFAFDLVKLIDSPFLYALYHYHRAAMSRNNDIDQMVRHMEKAKAYWPGEPLFDRMMSYWS